jgi:hypothetical protein
VDAQPGERPSIGEHHEKVLASLDPGSAPPSLAAAALTVTREELNFLAELAPLMGNTPRSVKRFVNVYQLVKIVHRGTPQPEAASTLPAPPDEELLGFLLALGDGLPELAPVLMDALTASHTDLTLQQVLMLPKLQATKHEQRRLDDWLSHHPQWQAAPAAALARHVPLVERFLFRVGERLLEPDSITRGSKVSSNFHFDS